MTFKRYIKIGSAAANDVQLTDSSVQPFHAQILQNTDGQVYLSTCVADAQVLVNGKQVIQTEEIFSDDQLQIGECAINLDGLVSWPQQALNRAEQALQETQSTDPEAKRGLSLQLILIYAAVALLLILMAFYV